MTASTAEGVRGRETRFERLESRRLLALVAPGFDPDVAYGGGLNYGTAMDFSPDGRLWVTIQGGDVWVIQPGGATPATLAGHLTVDPGNERGLLGIAFDPSFDAAAPGPDYVYFNYTARSDPTAQAGDFLMHNRVVRLEVNGDTIDPASETLVLRLDDVEFDLHFGGAIHFGPDGKLYVATGENTVTSNSQSVDNLLGKILRINPDPLDPIPTDNPASFPGITGTPTGQNRAIWAVGLRNPYTFAFQPGTGRMHINDVGQTMFEEVSHGQAGLNYGWPMTEGTFPPNIPNVTYPIHAYHNGVITGGAFYNTPAHTFPAHYAGDYFFADISDGWIRRLDGANNYAPVSSGGVNNGPNLVQNARAPVDVKVGPDGGLYFLQRDGSQGVRVVRPSDPLPYVMTTNFRFATSPHAVQFTLSEAVGGVGPEDLLLTNLTTGQTIPSTDVAASFDTANNTATFTFPGFANGVLPDGRYRATLLAAGITQAPAQDSAFNFFFLNGDANRDARVNLQDVNIVAANFGQSNRDFTQGDFDYDGIVNLRDFNILAGRFGQAVVPASTAPARPPSGTTKDPDRDDETDELLA